MKNLQQHQKLFCEEMVDHIYNHPRLKQHKRMFIAKLGRTIKCDFVDREATEQDYRICLWKAVVMLFYHHKYTFYCKICESSTYIGKNGKINTMDRIYTKCPSCGAEHDPDVVGKSPIAYKVGERYCADPYAIIDDEKQLASYFGEWINNAITQQLFENTPTTIRKQVTVTTTYLEYVKSKIIDMLKRNKIAVVVDEDYIRLPVMFYSPGFINSLVNVVPDYKINGVLIDVTEVGLKLTATDDCKTIKFKKPVHELVKLENQAQDQESTVTIYDRPISDDHSIEKIDIDDFVRTKFDYISASIFQIWRHTGTPYNRYTILFGDKITWGNIAKMFRLSPKQLKRRRNDIKAVLSYYSVST